MFDGLPGTENVTDNASHLVMNIDGQRSCQSGTDAAPQEAVDSDGLHVKRNAAADDAHQPTGNNDGHHAPQNDDHELVVEVSSTLVEAKATWRHDVDHLGPPSRCVV